MPSIEDHADYWHAQARQPGNLCYVALGDSLAQGFGASAPERGYVGALSASLARHSGRTVRVVNLGVCGATVRELVQEQLPALAELRPDLVTACIGANDAGRTAPSDFLADFATVCAALPAGSFVADVPDFQGGHGSAAARELAAICRRTVDARADLISVGIEAATAGMARTEFGDEFAHPDDRGYQRYAHAFWAAIEPTL